MKPDSDDKRPQMSPMARLAGVLITLALGGLGVYTIVLERYVAPWPRYTPRPPTPTVIEGPLAIWNGLGLIAFGLTGLFVFARSARAAGTWVFFCMVSGVALMLLPAWRG